MKLTKIERIPEDTGLRALCLWTSDGRVTFGELPPGIAPSQTETGGIYIRRIRERVTVSFRGALTTSSTQTMTIPTGFRVGSAPYPNTGIFLPAGLGTAFVRVGSATLYLSIPTGTLISGSVAKYSATVSWDVTGPLPHPDTYPGLPA